MNALFRLMALLGFMFCFCNCSNKEEEEIVMPLDVNYANLHGTWKLVEWNDQPLAEGTYCFIEFKRKDHTFIIYQKFDSMYARYITGEFSLEEDEQWGDVISGVYDYGMGDWNNSYIITDLLEEGTMVWTVKGDETDVCKYERCNKIPDDVIAEVGGIMVE